MSQVVPIIKKILEYRKTGSVLDVGFGFGHHSLFLAEQGFSVTALDTDTVSVEKLVKEAEEKKLPIAAMVGDVRTLYTIPDQWDVVICTFVLHFLKDNEIEKAIAHLKAATKPGGLCVVAVHTIENVSERSRKPHLFEPDELLKLYADWNVLYDWYGLGKPFVSKRTGKTEEKYRAELIAEKPL